MQPFAGKYGKGVTEGGGGDLPPSVFTASKVFLFLLCGESQEGRGGVPHERKSSNFDDVQSIKPEGALKTLSEEEGKR